MQETQKFKLKLIEGTDPFSAEPLNQNAQALESAVWVRPRIVTGSYTGTGKCGQDHPTVLEVADAERPPAVVFVSGAGNRIDQVLIRGMTTSLVLRENYSEHRITLEWTDKGVRFWSANDDDQLNQAKTVYHYALLI